MKQLGLAFHNYIDVHKRFPPYCVSTVAAGNQDVARCWGYQMMILPFLDQAPLYSQLQVGQAPLIPNTNLSNPVDYGTAAANSQSKLHTTTLPVYLCPSANGKELNQYQNNLGTMMYAGNNQIFIQPPDANLMRGARSTTLSDISDGTSNTLLVGEKALMSAPFVSIGSIWGAGRICGSRICIVSGHMPMNTPFDGTHDATNLCYIENTPALATRANLASPHVGGAQLLLCDGSVRFVSENIDANPTPGAGGSQTGANYTYQKLFYLNDKFVIGEF